MPVTTADLLTRSGGVDYDQDGSLMLSNPRTIYDNSIRSFPFLGLIIRVKCTMKTLSRRRPVSMHRIILRDDLPEKNLEEVSVYIGRDPAILKEVVFLAYDEFQSYLTYLDKHFVMNSIISSYYKKAE